jgi:hypothetical protein
LRAGDDLAEVFLGAAGATVVPVFGILFSS